MSKPVLSDCKDFEIPIVQFYGFLKTHFVHFIGYSLLFSLYVTLLDEKVAVLQRLFLLNLFSYLAHATIEACLVLVFSYLF